MSILRSSPPVLPAGKPVPGRARPLSPVPVLQSGDRLTRDEFERRYEQTPEHFKAELVEGVVYVASPVRMNLHGRPTRLLSTWMGVYESQTPGVFGGDNATARLDLDNEPQPDLLLMIDPAAGGQAGIDAEDYVVGAPELVAEIAASSASIDLNAKLNVYRRTQVREYIVWRPAEGAIDWFTHDGSTFVPLAPSQDGILRSSVFPGLWLDVPALLAGDIARVLEVVRQGAATPEHQAFIDQLATRAHSAGG